MSLMIDGLIIIALVGAIFYGLSISRRLEKLMSILRDLEPAISAFSEAVDKSESSAAGLRSAAVRLADEVGQARTQTRTKETARSRPTAANAFGRPGGARPSAEKKQMVRGFYEAMQARNG